MDIPKDLILVQSDGTLKVAGDEAKEKLRQAVGRYHLVDGPHGLLILRRMKGSGYYSIARVMMAGELLSKTTILDVVGMVGHSMWRGELHVYGADSHRGLTFDQGALKSAFSNVPSERLGEILVSRGVITQKELAEGLKYIGGKKRLGEVLVEKGYLDREELFKNLRLQIEQIFYATLMVRDGTYMFALPDENAEPPALSLHLPVQGLLMEGVQRIDEMAQFRDRIPSGNMCPVANENVSDKDLDAGLRLVVPLMDGKRSILDIAKNLGWDEFQATKAVYQLMQIGYVTLRSSAGIDREAVVSLLAQFNEAMKDIFDAVSLYGGVEETRVRLNAWVAGSGYSNYFGEEIDPQGVVDTDRVIATLEKSHVKRPMEILQQALHELAAFAMFAATPELPRNAEMTLARKVNERLVNIRL